MRALNKKDEEKSIELSIELFTEVIKFCDLTNSNGATVAVWGLTRVLGGIIGQLNMRSEIEDELFMCCETLIRAFAEDYKEHQKRRKG